ncbi:hypothetical protein EYZ11_004695 [Aspergillus tanneri]|uniref:Major facilitator superfamily (MFS) profile domain-containing protein n=1 Tax=Aspergillus tanneri TaxID=1220188 RepID=A0A4S3JKD4_9EURO|nr:hypothetical protein EYZ11_004695 [Aspergillus tanneri]
MAATELLDLESNSAAREPESGEQISEGSFAPNRPVILTVFATFLGELLASADESLMTAMYTAIASEFCSLSQGSWLLVAYNFGSCVSSPVCGLLGDLFGRKNVVIWSSCFFLLGCIACGASTSMSRLIAARALAGLSGAGMVSLVSVIIAGKRSAGGFWIIRYTNIITYLVPPSEVAVYRSYTNVVSTVGRSLGGPVGGFLTQTVGWRWSFYGQVPFVLVSILITVRQMPCSLNRTREGLDSTSSKFKQIDFLGIVSFTATIYLFLVMLQNFGSNESQQSHQLYVLGGALFGSATVFFSVEVFWATTPLIPLNLMKTRFGSYCISQLLLTTGRSAVMLPAADQGDRLLG